jgi:hypothetical protein
MAGALRKSIHCSPVVLICVGLLTSGAVFPAVGKAQPKGPVTPPVVMGDPARRDVRLGPDVPNFSGVWLAQTSNRSTPPYDGSATPFLPWAQQYFDRRGEAERNGQPLFDPNANCLPGGVPRIISSPYPIDITQTPNLMMISTETLHEARMIHMDGKPKPANFVPSYFGYSVGHFEGDALVVETTGLSPYTQVDEEGRPKSTGMKVVERYQKHAPNILEVTYTLYDPRTYSRPWSIQARFRWAPEMSLGEYICEENNRNKPDATGKLRHGSEQK